MNASKKYRNFLARVLLFLFLTGSFVQAGEFLHFVSHIPGYLINAIDAHSFEGHDDGHHVHRVTYKKIQSADQSDHWNTLQTELTIQQNIPPSPHDVDKVRFFKVHKIPTFYFLYSPPYLDTLVHPPADIS